jgi:arylsulfatase A-like enzyme
LLIRFASEYIFIHADDLRKGETMPEQRPSRREFFLATGGLAAAAILADACTPGVVAPSSISTPSPTPGHRGDQPNLLILMTDQERAEVTLPAGFHLPARESLWGRGVRFTRHHTPTAPCSPARSTVFTGVHEPVNGIHDNCGQTQADLSPGIATLGTVLQAAGYRTAYAGKWHLTNTTTTDPTFLQPYGFDESFHLSGNGAPNEGTYSDPGVATAASAWLAAHAADVQPWCLVVSLINPHDMMWCPRFYRLDDVADHGAEPPANFETDLSTKPQVQTVWRAENEVVGGIMPSDPSSPTFSYQWRQWSNWYLELLRRTDDLMASVLGALDDSGRSADTVVVGLADHGELGGAHGLRQKGAMIYQENLRVPLVVADPRRSSTHGTTTTSLTSHIDIVPTLASLAGATASLDWLRGHDLSRVLDEPDTRVRDELLVTSDAPSSGLGLPGLRYVMRGVITEQYSYGRYSTPQAVDAKAGFEIECYDRDSDPGELHNLGHGVAAPVCDDLDDLVDQLIAAELEPLP